MPTAQCAGTCMTSQPFTRMWVFFRVQWCYIRMPKACVQQSAAVTTSAGLPSDHTDIAGHQLAPYFMTAATFKLRALASVALLLLLVPVDASSRTRKLLTGNKHSCTHMPYYEQLVDSI